ncbi:MAG: YfiR family protein [Bacteroidota bacterium]
MLFRRNNRILIGIALFTVVFGASNSLKAQDFTKSQNKLKSIFIYNFLKYVEWPKYSSADVVKICLVGEGDIYSELNNLAQTKKIQNRKVQISKIESLSECTSCDLVFINENTQGVKRPGGCNTFIVTDNNFEEGISNINLKYNADGRLGFEINSGLCEDNGYKVSSALKSLAF